jgi:hypothetical protein
VKAPKAKTSRLFVRKRLFVALASFLAACGIGSLYATPTVLSRDGEAAVQIMHAAGAHEAIVETAQEMAEILGRMTGATFAVAPGNEANGIILGTVAGFPEVPGADRFDPKDILRQEDYIIHTDGERVWLIGANVAGATHAAWDFLHRLGFRQYFPGADWEIVPKGADLTADIDVFESPDFHVRHFAWHYGAWPDLREESDRWGYRNRLSNRFDLPGTFRLHTSHIYGTIFSRHREEIMANPGITSEVDGRITSKFNPANPRTLEIVEEFAADYFEKNPEATSISMDPSDGGGWGTSAEELAIGTPSDRAVFLANHVARFVNERFGQKYVGMCAYNEHSPAPANVRVDPGVIVSIATSFIQGGYTVEDLIKTWRAAGSEMLGIREYHSVVGWDLSRPTGGRASNLDYLIRTIPAFHADGVRFYITEAGLNWGPQGLGNYLTTRMLWDVNEAQNADAIVDEFLMNCFPEAREPMGRFYRDLLHPPRARILSEDSVGRMYRTLQEARELTTDETALRRLDALILYTRYAELLLQHSNSTTEKAPNEVQHDAAVELIKHAYRIRKSQMMSSLALFRDLPRRNSAIQMPDNVGHRVPEGENPWKDTRPITAEDIETFLKEGIANNQLLDFEPVAFSTDLVSAKDLPAVERSLQFLPARNFNYNLRRVNRLHTWSEMKDDSIEFTAIPGTIAQNLGDLTLTLFSGAGLDSGQQAGEQQTGDQEMLVDMLPADEVVLPPDREEHKVALAADAEGHFFIRTQDSAGGFRITNWPEDRPFTLDASEEFVFTQIGRPDLVFYVPRGTKILGIFTRGQGTIYDGDNRPAIQLEGPSRHVSIPVAEGMDGKFWRFSGMVGSRIQLLTVPPFMAPSALQLMLPREVIEADRPKTPDLDP